MEWSIRCEHMYRDLDDIERLIKHNISVLLNSFSSVYAICGVRSAGIITPSLLSASAILKPSAVDSCREVSIFNGRHARCQTGRWRIELLPSFIVDVKPSLWPASIILKRMQLV